jgi:hypothetical protein
MTGVDSGDSPATRTAPAVTRRRLLAVIGGAAAAAQISAVTGGPLGPSPAAATPSPPAYDAIVGLL